MAVRECSFRCHGVIVSRLFFFPLIGRIQSTARPFSFARSLFPFSFNNGSLFFYVDVFMRAYEQLILLGSK